MIKIYVGCALTDAPEEFRQSVEKLKTILRRKYEILEFLGLITGSPSDVYQHDIRECVANCDLFVAISDHPSTGLGFELAAAILQYEKPILVVAHGGARITRLVLGIPDHHPSVTLERYEAIEDIAVLVDQKVIQVPCLLD